MASTAFDVAVVGAGIVGSAIARELGRYDLRVIVLEREGDVGEGTSKANSAIIHSGFDAPVGTLEADLLARARPLWDEILARDPILSVATGALMVALDTEDETRLDEVAATARANGVAVQAWTAAQARARVPALSPAARGALWIEAERIVDPFQAVRAFAEAAIAAGVEMRTRAAVVAAAARPDTLVLHVADGAEVRARFVVNAAGLWADEVAALMGDESLRITPRKGEFLVAEETLGVDTVLLPVPSPRTKGILVTPIAFGGLLLGPTAVDQENKGDRATTAAGLAAARAGAARLVPGVADLPSVRQFAGLRAVNARGGYHIAPSGVAPRLLHVAGIRSTGLSASPAIARYVVERLAAMGVDLGPARALASPRPLVFATGKDDDGEVLCLCRSVTTGEVRAALSRPPLPRTLDALKRRTGAMLGECQGSLCVPRVLALLVGECHLAPAAVRKSGSGSEVAVAGTISAPARPRRGAAVPWPLDPGRALDVLVVGAGDSGRACLAALEQAGVEAMAIDWGDFDARGTRARTTAVGLGRLDDGRIEVYLAGRGAPPSLVARAVVAATGAVEEPREHASVPGERPAGVVTPYLALALLADGLLVGRRPLVWLDGGTAAEVAAALERAGARVERRGPTLGDRRVLSVAGGARVERVAIEGGSGEVEDLEADALVFAAGRIPTATFLKAVPAVWRGERPLAVDGGGRTALPGLYATGSVVLPHPGHALCAEHGRLVARAVVEDLQSPRPWPTSSQAVAAADTSGLAAVAPVLGGPWPKGLAAFALTGHRAGELVAETAAGRVHLGRLEGGATWHGTLPDATWRLGLEPEREEGH